MTATHNRTDMQPVLWKVLQAHAARLANRLEAVWCPSRHVPVARRPDGGLLRLDFGDWPAPDLRR